jgi:hypothetical protein
MVLCGGLVAAGLPSAAWGYSVTKSTGCSYPNNNWEVKWAAGSIPVTYKINVNGTPDCDGEFQAAQNGFQAWENECRSTIDFTYGGTSNLGPGSWASNDGTNLVVWCETNWNTETGAGDNTIAINYYFYACADGHLLDSDIIMNGEDFTWSTTGEANKEDVQNVMTHETGHSLSLYDLYGASDTEKTMYGYISLGETKKCSLEQDDRDGVAYLYPSNANERLYVKDASDDYGCVPYGGTVWWDSDDITLSPNPPVIGQQATVTVRARNMRPSNVQAKVTVEIHDPTVSLNAGQNVLWTSTQNNVAIAPGYSDVTFQWTPAANSFGEGHYCCVATVETADGVTDIVVNSSPPNDDDVACHNFCIVDQASGSGGSSDATVDAANYTIYPGDVWFTIDRSELPDGWTAQAYMPSGFPYPEGMPIFMPPGMVYPMRLQVTPPPTAMPGETGTIGLVGTLNMGGPLVQLGGVFLQVRITGLTGVETGLPTPALAVRSYPNPFHPMATLEIEFTEPGPAAIMMFDAAGRKLRTLFDGTVAAGRREVRWDGRDDAGRDVPAGVYFYRVRTQHGSADGHLVLMK